MPYIELVGGILSLPIKVYLRANGFSNLYWGWGAEDDDMYERLTANGIPVTRPDPKVSMFKMLRHPQSPSFPLRLRSQILALGEARYRLDGLNSLNYTLVDQHVKFYPRFDENVANVSTWSNRTTVQHWLVHLKIDVGQAPSWLRLSNL
ncbi:beta-1 4-N-acetylgalactosaminyltransferase bre-4 [Fasciolopsis buskii]|uniref:Beta-1 4-N-acetylgalactosaminyltransferase bre-4 n=1 Tax=Fasciolopsis buskii TaxID=27845 RepID=A0A8E0RXU2_9TREM|nr:beta-1 4-N-acetylgalactosaminyltransferase bre-4 [Fasciolopsis buski]